MGSPLLLVPCYPLEDLLRSKQEHYLLPLRYRSVIIHEGLARSWPMLLHGGENYPVVPLSPGADDNTNSVSSSCCPLYPHLSRPPEILVHRTRKLTSRTLYIRRDVLCVRDGVPLGAQIDAVSGRQPRESTQPGCIVVVVSNNRTAFTTTVSLPSCQFYCFLSNEPWLPNRSGSRVLESRS